MLDVTTVHTTGVNATGLIANVASITSIVAVLGAIGVHSVKRAVKDQITTVVEAIIAREITPQFNEIKETQRTHSVTLSEHAASIAYLTGVDEGRKQERVIHERRLDAGQ